MRINNKNENYLHIENGQIKEFSGQYIEGKTPARAKLKELRETAIKCNRLTSSLAEQIDIINAKIGKHNNTLAKGYFGWFFKLFFKIEKVPPLVIKATYKIGEMGQGNKAKKIQNQLMQMSKNRDLSERCVLSAGPSKECQTVVTYNPVSMKLLLNAGRESVVQLNGVDVKTAIPMELIRGKNTIEVVDSSALLPEKVIVIELL